MSAEFWVAASFFIFLGLLAYLGVHKKILGALDARGAKISEQLNEAARLRAEAADLLKSFEMKRVEAEKEAIAIVSAAKAEAARMEAEAKIKLEEFVLRRTAQAEFKIAQAEAQATADVRAAASETAIKAASALLSANKSDDAFLAGLNEIKTQLN
jgi:F-type H+-transporting ATPase subunit b